MAAVIRANLERVLQGAQAKTDSDKKWFSIQSNGALSLYDRPTGCLSWIVELIGRLTYMLSGGKRASLVNRCSTIAQDVNTYLVIEIDKERMSEFLNKYTAVLNQLYHTATRLSYRSVPNISLEKVPAFESLVMMDRYLPKADAKFVVPSMPFKGSVKFKIGDRRETQIPFVKEWEQSTPHKIGFQKSYYEGLDSTLKVTTQNRNYLQSSGKLIIHPNGEVTHVPSPLSLSDPFLQLQIENQSSLQAHLELEGCYSQGSEPTQILELQPNDSSVIKWSQTKAAAEGQKEERRLSSIHYTANLTQTAPLRFGLKAGEYICTFDANHRVEIQPMVKEVVRTKIPTQTINNGRLEFCYPNPKPVITPAPGREVVIHNDSANPIEVDIEITKTGEDQPFRTIKVKQIKIGPHTSQTFTYAQLCERADDYLSRKVIQDFNGQRSLSLDFAISIKEWKI